MTHDEYTALRRLYRTLKGEAIKAMDTPREATASVNLQTFVGLVQQLHGFRFMASLYASPIPFPLHPAASWRRRYRRRAPGQARPYASRTASSPHCALNVLPLP